MSLMQLNPMHLKVSGLLGGRLFRIPEYQRAYAWGSRQREDLFNDIIEVHASGREHFMATVVALARDNRLIGADEYKTVELVDGQQRITTIVILLKAIQKNLKQDDPIELKISREISELLVKGDDHSLILLQTNHSDSNLFQKYIRTGEIDIEAITTAADQNVANSALECENFVAKWRKEKSVIELVATIRNKLSMIYHEIADEATVYRVFEVLNSRGLDVKWIDKLKSQLMALIFEHVESGSRDEAVKEMQSVWKGIYKTLGLRSDLGDEALRFAGTWSLKSRSNRIISQEDAAAELTKSAGTSLKSIAKVGFELSDIVAAVYKLHNDVRLNAVTRIVNARFVATAILLRKFEYSIEQKLLGKWERVTFRIYALGGADTRHKVGDYVRLGYDILSNKITDDEIEKRLNDIGEGYEIEKLLSDPDYWNECYTWWGEELRYLLFRYDEYLSEKSGEQLNSIQWSKIWLDDASKSIEHIMPQSSGEEYIHHLGNLTMLQPGVNSSLQDQPPKQKAATYVACGIKATAAVGSQIIAGLVWNEEAVRARAAEIEEFVRKEWAD